MNPMTREEFVTKLGEFIQPDKVEGWLNTPNPAFGGRTPNALWEAGDRYPLERMLVQLRGDVGA